jgi:protein-S-isoprenylcysteine O-methyltransferase Ste14
LSRPSAIVGTLVFLLLAPGTVVVLIPWLITGWISHPPFFGLAPVRLIGAAMTIAGGGLLPDAFVRFALEGGGTPAPVMPTRHLVVSGPYRYVRNPMYLAVVAAILGQSLFFGSLGLSAYGAIVWLACHVFVLVYEEPAMRRTYPGDYAAYEAGVGRWLPRLKPWSGAIT